MITPKSNRKGFTLLEILIVIALIAILIGIVVVALNPARQFANARNATRQAHLNTIMNAISSNMAENNGNFTCATGDLPDAATNMGSGVADYDIAPCLVPNFISAMPADPSADDAHWTSAADYNTGYTIILGTDNRITVAAPTAELSTTISLSR